jgi:hypothetical protein
MGHVLERSRITDPIDQAEWERLHAAMNNGPGRRMVDDQLAGRTLRRDDVDQAARYRALMRALEDGRTDQSLLAARELSREVQDMGLDRIEHGD